MFLIIQWTYKSLLLFSSAWSRTGWRISPGPHNSEACKLQSQLWLTLLSIILYTPATTAFKYFSNSLLLLSALFILVLITCCLDIPSSLLLKPSSYFSLSFRFLLHQCSSKSFQNGTHPQKPSAPMRSLILFFLYLPDERWKSNIIFSRMNISYQLQYYLIQRN